MPSATLKTKTAKTKKASPKQSSAKPVRSREKPPSKNTKHAPEVSELQGQVKNLAENFDRIESKLNTLVNVLHSQLKDHMRYGPEGLAREINKAKLLD